MTKLSTLEATEHFADLVERVASGKERIVLTQSDREVAAMVPWFRLAGRAEPNSCGAEGLEIIR